MNEPTKSSGKLGVGGWVVILVLVAFLVVAVFYAIHGWNSVAPVGIPPMGWVFLVAGIIVTLLVGGGLMALLFYSSRKGRDI